jgi:hypothetical protein
LVCGWRSAYLERVGFFCPPLLGEAPDPLPDVRNKARSHGLYG